MIRRARRRAGILSTRCLALAAFILAAMLIAGCSGGGTANDSNAAAAAAVVTTGDDASSAAPTFAVATPQTLPVTPVNIQYDIVDPKFNALPGARAIYGSYQGAGYQIEVPNNWNGDVVYFAHGFRGNPPQLTVSPPPLRDYFIAQGYAWAASSYSKNGYEPGAGARDTYALRDVFVSRVGTPKHSFLYGQSMGGHIASLSLEEYPDAYDGAFSECGVMSGHEILDFFLSWGTLAGYFSGTPLIDAATDAATLGKRFDSAVLPALGADPNVPTLKGRQFANVIENLTGGPRPFFREGFAANYSFNFLVLLNAVATAGPSNAAADNSNTTYHIDDGFAVDNAQLNGEIGRVSGNPIYRNPATYPEFAPMTGKIQRPLLTLHGTGDLFVPISLDQSYRKTVDRAGDGDLLVQRAIRRAGHCNFSERERTQGFEDLVRWVEQGQKPGGDDLLGDLSDIGRAYTTPLEPNDPGAISPAP